MKIRISLLFFAFILSHHIFGMDQIHLPRDKATRKARFQALLTQELTKIDKARWPEIQAALPQDASDTFHKDTQFNSDLIALRNDPKADYAQWVRLIVGFKARSGQLAVVAKKSADKKGTQKKDPTACLYDALAAADVTGVRELLVTHKDTIILNPQPTTPVTPPLHAAVKANCHGLCQALLDAGAEPNVLWKMDIQDRQDRALFITPLNYALDLGHTERVVQLLNHKADPNIPKQGFPSGFTVFPLDQVCSLKDLNKANTTLHTVEQTVLLTLLLKHKAHKTRRTVLCKRPEDGFGHPILLETEEKLPWIIDHITHTESNGTFIVLHVDANKTTQTCTKDKK